VFEPSTMNYCDKGRAWSSRDAQHSQGFMAGSMRGTPVQTPIVDVVVRVALSICSLPLHMGFGLKSQVAVKVVFSVFARSLSR
jgi:hypothetical protein